MSVTAFFEGGPLDGQYIALPDRTPSLRYHVPVAAAPFLGTDPRDLTIEIFDYRLAGRSVVCPNTYYYIPVAPTLVALPQPLTEEYWPDAHVMSFANMTEEAEKELEEWRKILHG